MAAVNLDLQPAELVNVAADIFQRWREKRQRDSAREENLKTRFYQKLSNHPILGYMHTSHPDHSSKWDEIDYYRKLVRAKQCPLFADASKYGYRGTKARIVLLFLWIIAQHLPKGMDVKGIISAALEDDPAGKAPPEAFAKLIDKFADLFRAPLPTEIQAELDQLRPPHRSHFSYQKFIASFLRAPMPGNRKHHAYDIAEKPYYLLRPQDASVLASKNLKTERVMVWAIYRLHLGPSYKAVVSPNAPKHGVAWVSYLPSE